MSKPVKSFGANNLPVRILLVFIFLLSLIPGDMVSARPASQEPEPGSGEVYAADSGLSLPEYAPVVEKSGPLPFVGIRSAANIQQEGPTPLPPPEGLMVIDAHEAQAAHMDAGAPDAGQAFGAPNLFPYSPLGWDGPVVLSDVSGSNHNTQLWVDEPVYADWAVGNGGGDILNTSFTNCLYIDGSAVQCWQYTNLWGGYYYYVIDYSVNQSISAGVHTVQLCADVYKTIQESNETDNCWQDSFNWQDQAGSSDINLRPFTVVGYWDQPLVLSGETHVSTSGGLRAGQPFYINWSIINDGPADIPVGTAIKVCVVMNGSQTLGCWTWSDGLPAGYYLYAENELSDVIVENPGSNTVQLVIDPDASIPEINENDNTWQDDFAWDSSTQADLVPYTPVGWSAQVLATSTSGPAGNSRLFADQISYLHFGVKNSGQTNASSFVARIQVDTHFTQVFTMSLQAGESATQINIPVSAGKISTGWHQVQLTLDPANTVSEDNEFNNTISIKYYWEGSGKVNLRPYQPDGWADAIVASAVTGTFTNTKLTAGAPAYIDWAVINDGFGNIPNGKAFTIILLLDGNPFRTVVYKSGLNSGWYLYEKDFALTVSTPGFHVIELRADTGNVLAESDETDNNLQVQFFWQGQSPSNVPDIRVEPTAINIQIPQAASTQSSEAAVMWRDMSQVQPQSGYHPAGGALISPSSRLWHRDPPVPVASTNDLLAQVDLSSKMPPVGDQGQGGSCVGWSVSYYYKSYQESIDQGWALNTDDHLFSPNYVWNQVQQGTTSQCGGAYPSDAFDLLAAQGDLPMSVFGGYTESCAKLPTQAQKDQASQYRAETSGTFFDNNHTATDADITEIKQWLAGGDVAQLSIPVLPEFDEPSGPYCIVDISSQPDTNRGGHSITIVGYNDNIDGSGKGGFKIINSWGTSWGCNGYGYITYDWVKQYAYESWWMRDIRTGGNTSRDFTIFNDGNAALKVTSIKTKNASQWLDLVLPAALPFYLQPGESKTVELAIGTSGMTNGTYNETIQVSSDDPDESLTEVSVSLVIGSGVSTPPPTAANPYPANYASSIPADALTLGWAAGSSGILYDVRLDTQNPPSTIVCNDHTSPSCLVSRLKSNTTYYWRVISNNTTTAMPGPIWSFTTSGSANAQRRVMLPLVRTR
jgi:C1A family cysteine protease